MRSHGVCERVARLRCGQTANQATASRALAFAGGRPSSEQPSPGRAATTRDEFAILGVVNTNLRMSDATATRVCQSSSTIAWIVILKWREIINFFNGNIFE